LTFALERYVKLPEADLPSIAFGTKPTEAASILRQYWELPDGPVKHLVATAESRGIVVAVRPLHEIDAVDAFSAVIVDRPIIITTPRRSENVFRHALLLSLSNPKAALFFLSFFIPFVNPQYPHPALSFFILAAVMQTLSMCYLATLALAGDKLLAKLRHKRNLAALGAAAVGLLFCLFAVKLWQSVFFD